MLEILGVAIAAVCTILTSILAFCRDALFGKDKKFHEHLPKKLSQNLAIAANSAGKIFSDSNISLSISKEDDVARADHSEKNQNSNDNNKNNTMPFEIEEAPF